MAAVTTSCLPPDAAEDKSVAGLTSCSSPIYPLQHRMENVPTTSICHPTHMRSQRGSTTDLSSTALDRSENGATTTTCYPTQTCSPRRQINLPVPRLPSQEALTSLHSLLAIVCYPYETRTPRKEYVVSAFSLPSGAAEQTPVMSTTSSSPPWRTRLRRIARGSRRNGFSSIRYSRGGIYDGPDADITCGSRRDAVSAIENSGVEIGGELDVVPIIDFSSAVSDGRCNIAKISPRFPTQMRSQRCEAPPPFPPLLWWRKGHDNCHVLSYGRRALQDVN